MIGRLIYKLRAKFEIGVAKGVIAEMCQQVDWDIDKLGLDDRRKISELTILIDSLEACL